jgi:hypothetical protein
LFGFCKGFSNVRKTEKPRTQRRPKIPSLDVERESQRDYDKRFVHAFECGLLSHDFAASTGLLKSSNAFNQIVMNI